MSDLLSGERRRGGRTSPRLHLTRRGRLLALTVLVLLLLAAFAGGRAAHGQATPGEDVVVPTPTQVTVQPGDTLWSLARRMAPERDTREVVTQLRRLNHLPSAGLQAGQQLLLPAVR